MGHAHPGVHEPAEASRRFERTYRRWTLPRRVGQLPAPRKRFDKEFTAAIEKGGYILLGWTDLGSVYVFSKSPIKGPEDMKKAKMWVWEGDPIAQAAYKAIGVTPIPLLVVDVLASLQTGLIDAVYGPPMGVIALQWHSRTKYIYNVPIAESTGAFLLSKKFFAELSPEEQKILLEVSAKHQKTLSDLSRSENAGLGRPKEAGPRPDRDA